MNDLSPIANLHLIMDNKLKAKFLYWLGWKIVDIAEVLNENERTVQAWKTRDDWEKEKPENRVENALTVRLMVLILKNKKTSGDIKEIDMLMRQYKEFARIEKYRNDGSEADLNPEIRKRNSAPRKKIPNHFTEEQIEELVLAFEENLFDYQWTWYRAGDQRSRAILKSRQIGATYYFAREALIDALKTGRNQVFLSASKAQAHIFKHYIKAFAADVCGVELTGDPIVLSNGAEMLFLGTNYRTAQGHHGNFYFDEFFWTHGFNELEKVASAMALHKKWRKTYFSTPSTITHEAYGFWTGARFNKGRPKNKQVTIDVSHDSLKKGRLCEDRIWRQIVTITDAEEGGCDLFNIDDLRFEYSADDFENLLMCKFVDDGQSMFPLNMLMHCMVDSLELWSDFKVWHNRPFANKPVWVGYDPALSGDNAGLVVLAPPAVAGGKFRVLERHQFKGDDFAQQAEHIRHITRRYNVTYIGIDTTGMGIGVAELVKQFFPAVHAFKYSPEVKAQLVYKTLDVIRNGRLEYDAGDKDMTQSLMSIKKTMTSSQKQITFTAGRSEEIGHADLAWAFMHAIYNEPLAGITETNTSVLEIYS
ncbi:terminase large subunit domain-containing protein [Acinetobacter pseudolwoffii]|uniref:Terminase n=1 Tax=Acinetobacter pseudolwoffii TaxID=2053287 RepID=A0A2H9UN97_9GAMM|nr:terminase family protein [Acinetobacter pseudolwoffii]PJI33133.1 terminase [Acinetobacter pseudolwoffii]